MKEQFLLYTSPVNSTTTGVSRNKVGVLEKAPKKVKFYMLKICTITLIASWGALITNNPYLIAALFGLVLLLVACFLRFISSFVRFIIFLVYVGGIMILIRYCVILLPSNKFLNARALVIPVVASLLLSSIFTSRSRAYSFGLLQSFHEAFFPSQRSVRKSSIRRGSSSPGDAPGTAWRR